MYEIRSSDLNRETLIKLFKYQPFRLPDRTITGAGMGMLRDSKLRALKPGEDDENWPSFLEASENQTKMYEDIINGIEQYGGGFAGRKYADIACNAGYYCYRALELGARAAVGVDANDFSTAFDVVNADRGFDAEFIRAPYDMKAHSLIGLPSDFKADIVSNIAFMCHASDPTFLLAALAEITRKTLVLFTKVTFSDDYSVKFSQATKRYFGGTFPICFDAATEISEGLLRFGLAELGFSKVTELEHQSHWVPSTPEWRAFVAVR